MKNLHEKIYVAGQLKATDFESLSASGIKTIINNRPDDEEPGQLSSKDAAKLAEENGMAYHYLPMVNGQPLAFNMVEDFKGIIDSSDGKILAHCRSGMRSTFIWALGQIPSGNISVDHAIEKAQAVGIPLDNARTVLESVQP